MGHLIENGHAGEIGRKQVAGELDALERAVKGPGQSMGQRGFADSGNVFNEQVPSSQQRNDRQFHDFRLSFNDFFNRGLKRLNLALERARGSLHGLYINTLWGDLPEQALLGGVVGVDAEVVVGEAGDGAAAGGAIQKADLNEIGFVDVLYGVLLFADRG